MYNSCVIDNIYFSWENEFTFMKKHFSIKKMATLALVIVCVSVPFTSFAHKAWCSLLGGVGHGAAGQIIDVTAVKTTTSTSYSNITQTQHTRTVTVKKTCSLCSDEWVASEKKYTENHSWKMERQDKSNGYIITTYKCSGCKKENVVRSRMR